MRSLVVLSLALSLGCSRAPTKCVEPEPAAAAFSAPEVAAPELQRSISAPPPIDVCRRVRDIARNSQAALPEQLVDIERDCVATLEQVQQTYDKLASCLFNAAEDAQIGACEDAMRRWTEQLDSFSLTPTYLAICDHVLTVMKRELDATGIQPSDAEMAKFTAKCTEDLAKERAIIGEGKFQEQVRCVMAATTLDGLLACDKDEPQP